MQINIITFIPHMLHSLQIMINLTYFKKKQNINSISTASKICIKTKKKNGEKIQRKFRHAETNRSRYFTDIKCPII